MRLRIAELDGGEFFHGTMFEGRKELFDVMLVEWLNEVVVVSTFDSSRTFRVNTNNGEIWERVQEVRISTSTTKMEEGKNGL